MDTPSLPLFPCPLLTFCDLRNTRCLKALKIFNLHFKFHKMEMSRSLKSFHVL